MKVISFLFLGFSFLSSLYSAEVTKVKIKKVDEQVKVVVFTDAVEYKDTVVHEPERIAIDFKNSFSHLPKELPSKYSPILRLRTSQYQLDPPITRVVLDLEYETTYSISTWQNGIEITLGKLEEKESPLARQAPMESPDSLGEVAPPVTGKASSEIKPARPDTMRAKKREKAESESLRTEPFSYNPRGKHDPFKPYLGMVSRDTLLDISTAKLVGIMWSSKDRYAIAEDPFGKRYILQEGDPVSGGRVIEIRREEIIFLMRVFGGTKRVAMKIGVKEEKK